MTGLRGRPAVALVARREITQRVREKSFLVSMGVTIAIVVLVAVVPPLVGFGGTKTYTLGVSDAASLPVAQAAARDAKAFDAKLHIRRLSPAGAKAALDGGHVDAVLSTRGLASKEQPDNALVGAVQAASREVRQARALGRAGLHGAAALRALSPPPVRVTTTKPTDPERDRKGTFAFVAVLRSTRSCSRSATCWPAGSSRRRRRGWSRCCSQRSSRATCWRARSSGSACSASRR